ncbi:MAG: tRNA pseudouridine(38-40) synthase TruA [Anaerolineaceae bacterium]|nr:tRNA pseudouridine(38-40) synthase TruA [Anaerolineaceae bacterium]
MARYQIVLAYDGTQYLGFQRQGASKTVQLEVETALRKLLWQGQSILVAGRTDSGVHASGQVIAFDLEWNHPDETLGKALNANLPADISVKQVQKVGSDFHPRFDACARNYLYWIYCDPVRDPLQDRYRWRIWPELNLELLNAAARYFCGTHDFSSFGRPMKPGGSTERTVYQADWKETNGLLCFQITANAFLYHMVRRIVFILVQISQEKLSLEELILGIEEKKPMRQGIAPPNGLVLTKIDYQFGDWKSRG